MTIQLETQPTKAKILKIQFSVSSGISTIGVELGPPFMFSQDSKITKCQKLLPTKINGQKYNPLLISRHVERVRQTLFHLKKWPMQIQSVLF